MLMKKLSVLFVALAVALSASAAGRLQLSTRKGNPLKLQKENVMTKQDKQALAKAKKSPARVAITDIPEGQLLDFQRAGGVVYRSSGQPGKTEQTGYKSRFCFADDGTTVYVRDLLCASSYHTWVKGTVEGNTLTIPLGQSIYYSDYYDADVVLVWGTTVIAEDGTISFTPDESVTELTYTIDTENQTYSLNNTVAPEEGSYVATGLTAHWTDDGYWSGVLEYNTVYSDPADPPVAPTMITEQPEGDLYTYLRSGACIYSSLFGLGASEVDGKLNVVFGKTDGELDGKVYIQNPSWWYENGNWVEGTYDWMTGLISIPVGQYIAYDEDNEYGVQLMWGATYVYQDVDENGEEGYYLGTELDEEATEIQFMIDDDVIYLLNSDGDLEAEFPENYNATGLYLAYSDDQSWAGALEFNIQGKILNVVPAVPADPIVDEEAWYDYGDESGYSNFSFTLPTEDVDGNPIDPDLLSYSIFIDEDEENPFVFDAETYYYDLDEDMTEIPYYIYSSGYDFYPYRVYFYRTNEGDNPLFTQRIGIQVYYTVDSPEAKVAVRNASNIVYYKLPNTAIESVKAELDVNAPIYNIMGQKMNGKNLPAGVYIQAGKKFIVK